MSTTKEKILSESLKLSPIDRAELIENLMTSFEFPERKKIDELWTKESEDRIDAYEKGEIDTVSMKDVFDNINKS